MVVVGKRERRAGSEGKVSMEVVIVAKALTSGIEPLTSRLTVSRSAN
jgi:hypothetical protein